jgi:Dockerin type I domain
MLCRQSFNVDMRIMREICLDLRFRVWHLLALCAAVSPMPVLGATITIGASKDTTIYQNNVNNSSGGGNGLFAGTNGTASPRRGLIAFDIVDNVPAGSTITDVQLTLFVGQVAGSGGSGSGGTATIDLHRLLADWGEGTTQKQTPPNDSFVGLGQGAAANSGDATWNSRFFSTSLWNTPGGDFASAASATASVGTTLNTATVWGSTASLVSDVQQWLATPAVNFGWALVNADETTAMTFRAFYTRDTATAALCPQLQITYTDSPVVGDINGDGHVTGADIQLMMEALTDRHAYEQSHNVSDATFVTIGDVDHNQAVNNADLQALLGKIQLGGGSVATTVPEPSSLALVAIGATCCMLPVIRPFCRRARPKACIGKSNRHCYLHR